MSKSAKSPARKPTKPASNDGRPTKEAEAKDAATGAKQAKPVRTLQERDPRMPKAGTHLTRAWRGKTIDVAVGAYTIDFRGKTYSSLSAIASELLECPVNGPLWFGLREKRDAAQTVAKSAESLKSAKAKKPAEPKIGTGNELATAAGQRAALAAVGIAKKPAAKATPSTKGATK